MGISRRNSSPLENQRWPLVFYVAIGTAVIVTITILYAVYGVNTRLTEQGEYGRSTVARQTGIWMADRLAVATDDSRFEILRSLAEKEKILCGLFSIDGSPIVQSPLVEIPKTQMAKIVASQLNEIDLDGRVHDVFAVSLKPPLSSQSVVVAVPVTTTGLSGGALVLLSICFGVAAVLIVVGSFVYGNDFRRQLVMLQKKLEMVVCSTEERSTRKRLLFAFDEWHSLAQSIEMLEQRVDAEMAMYLDARHEVETMDGRRTDLLTAVSLDLYKPLEKVVSLSNRLLEGKDGELPEPQREDVEIVQKASMRLKGMVEEIVDLSSLMTGRVAFDPIPVNLAQVAADVVNEARGQLGNKKLTVRLIQDDDTPHLVFGNRQRLWQILTNLMSNGIKFTESGHIEVSISRLNSGRIQVQVADTGVGIDAADLKSVFKTFEQSGARSGRKQGTGLGLAICKRLVVLHNGTISVKSTLGKGTVFSITIPEAL